MVPQQQRRRRRRAALVRTAERRVIVARGSGGFGFTIAGQRPCIVSAVAAGGPAERAGLRAGDALLAVDGTSVARAPHASVARMVAAAPGAISLSVALRESAPTDTEDTEPEERARTRRRYPPPRRRPQQAMMHHPGCHAAPSTSGVNEILQNLSRAQLTPNHAARLECRAVVGYLGTIETPQATATAAPSNVRNAVKKLRQERRPATPVLLSVLPNALLLRRPTGQVLAQYPRERIVYAGCGSEADRRYFGLVTAAEISGIETEASHSCHVFAVDSRMAEHEAHVNRARDFQIVCTRDPVAERCLEFPPSAEYVVGVIRGMYSLPPDDCVSPNLQQISKLAVKGDSPALGNFSRCNRPVFRAQRDRRPCRQEDQRIDVPEFVANSPQPSNHSEVTTTSSNSDSGIGFHNDCRNIADRILVVEFAGQQPPPSRFRQEMPRRPMGLVGCSSFDNDGSFLSNTTPVVDGFGGQGRPLNLDDVILNANDLPRPVGQRTDEDSYNYNSLYGNLPTSSRSFHGVVYDQVYTENEGHYELVPQELDDIDRVAETFNSVEIYEDRSRHPPDYHSNESVENVTVVSGRSAASAASADSVSVYSSRSHEEARPRRRHLQASLDDMLVLGLRDPPPPDKDDGKFLHPASVKCKFRKSKPLNILSKTKNMLTGKESRNGGDKAREREGEAEGRRRALSASAGDVSAEQPDAAGLPAAASEPDLRDQSEQSSPFRRWTTGSGAGSSYRHHDHRNMYSKQMSEGSGGVGGVGGAASGGGGAGGVARWSLGLEQLLADPAGAAAFAHFLAKEFAAENIRFWWSCEQYRVSGGGARAQLAGEIWSRHLADGAPEPVNVDAAARRAAAARTHLQPPPDDLFLQAQKQIFNVMKFDSYPRFLRSGVHAECARADLRGLPPPYAPHNTPTTEDATPTKLKKSASNASERRRSGGASLLPWKLRGASRERADRVERDSKSDAARDRNERVEPPTLADVVKSGTQGAGSLCRVVLPDGATSVVGVEEGVAVRRLVDRLLQRRNLPVLAYDVLLRDEQGVWRAVEAGAGAGVLAGREARVERRVVLRLALGARVLAVRCRAARPLRHVLRPVLRRHAPAAAHVLRNGRPVNPDTPVHELDGALLEIVESCEGVPGAAGAVGAAAAGAEREDDADSLSDLAVRLQEDTDQMSVSSRSRGECAGTPAVSNSSGSSGNVSSAGSGGSAGGAAGEAGRVRAALRPGPPLHHHPPEFLENLREKQRQRQNPRTPPPLPPKPAHRSAPTVV
ncbi:PREDICTED: regulator of G-protein signaling loco [Papilio polytes]|uniref:regulator of G-protein signaling loco n=1 Tax=Papilio polytes TaxID=76194 RepID=UPI000675E92B|nr:PREDICTED: regulator of G-protein signaling loco [Papilio polytes]